MEKIKKVLVVMLSCMLMIGPIPAKAAGNNAILVVGEQLAVQDGRIVPVDARDATVYPYLVKDRLMIPARSISEFFGAEVGWDGSKKEISISYQGKTTVFQIGKTDPTLGIDVPAELVDGITFVPVRAVAEHMLGMQVAYEPTAKVILLTQSELNSQQITSLSQQAVASIQQHYPAEGLTEDETHMVINGRIYQISGQIRSIPIIDFNYRLIDERLKRDMQSLMKTVTFDANVLNQEGERITKRYSVDVRKEIAEDVEEILKEIYEKGGLIKPGEVGAFRLGSQDFNSLGEMTLPNHPNGLAIDLSPSSNPYGYYTRDEKFHVMTGGEYDPENDPYAFTADGVVVKTFQEHGWGWGGSWNTWKPYNGTERTLRDFMHFSLNGN